MLVNTVKGLKQKKKHLAIWDMREATDDWDGMMMKHFLLTQRLVPDIHGLVIYCYSCTLSYSCHLLSSAAAVT